MSMYFVKIDEEPFTVLYSETGLLDSPVNTAISIEFNKHSSTYTDDELIGNFCFKYPVTIHWVYELVEDQASLQNHNMNSGAEYFVIY